MKKCNKCKVNKKFNDFSKHPDGINGYNGICKVCINIARRIRYKDPKRRSKILERSKKWRKSNPFKNKNSNLKYLYGITLNMYEEMLNSQKKLCKICKKLKRLVVDHCHKTDKVRGLLCSNCNTLIGLAKEDIYILNEASLYLTINKNNTKVDSCLIGDSKCQKKIK